MGDRQDIDALLIGALYGELDAADEARLEAHLSSHPGDRAAMDSLLETRARVRDSLTSMPQMEPAPAISTLILQEAARRAPRKAGTGVMAWLSSVFRPIVAHPALAGAMTLVLVGGVAGVLYKTGRVDGASHTTVSSTTAAGSAAPAGAPALEPAQRQLDNPRDGYQVQLADPQAQAENERGRAAGSGSGAPDETRAKVDQDQTIALDGKAQGTDRNIGMAPTAAHRGQVAGPAPKATAAAPATDALAKNGGKAPRGYVEVTTPDRQLKSLDDAEQTRPGNAAGGGGGGGATATGNTIAAGDNTAAPAPPPQAAATPAYDNSKDVKLDEWAQVQHKRLQQLVRDGKCRDAGTVGSEIAARAPEYYAAYVENDRAVKGCKQYIDQDKRKKANEKYKSRARNASEVDLAPMPTAN